MFIPFPSWLGYIDTLGSVASRGKQGAARGSTAVRTAVCLVFKEVGGWGRGLHRWRGEEKARGVTVVSWLL